MLTVASVIPMQVQVVEGSIKGIRMRFIDTPGLLLSPGKIGYNAGVLAQVRPVAAGLASRVLGLSCQLPTPPVQNAAAVAWQMCNNSACNCKNLLSICICCLLQLFSAAAVVWQPLCRVQLGVLPAFCRGDCHLCLVLLMPPCQHRVYRHCVVRPCRPRR
jgi:hypothetical protein